MNDLTAALAILADKLRLDVEELSDRFILNVRIIAMVELFLCLIGAYLAYKVIDYVYQQFIKNDMFLGGVKAKLEQSRDTHAAKAWLATMPVIQKDLAAGAKLVRTVLLVIVVGAFVFGAVRQIPTMIAPEGTAIEKIMTGLNEATKFEIVQVDSNGRETKVDKPTRKD